MDLRNKTITVGELLDNPRSKATHNKGELESIFMGGQGKLLKAVPAPAASPEWSWGGYIPGWGASPPRPGRA